MVSGLSSFIFVKGVLDLFFFFFVVSLLLFVVYLFCILFSFLSLFLQNVLVLNGKE